VAPVQWRPLNGGYAVPGRNVGRCRPLYRFP
jgi:hypothetical protein